jgi:hypothetical protein
MQRTPRPERLPVLTYREQPPPSYIPLSAAEYQQNCHDGSSVIEVYQRGRGRGQQFFTPLPLDKCILAHPPARSSRNGVGRRLRV